MSINSDDSADAHFAAHRFGFGPRGDTASSIGSDPRGALIAELDRRPTAEISGDDLRPSDEAARTLAAAKRAQAALRRNDAAQRKSANATNTAMPEASMDSSGKSEPAPKVNALSIYRQEAKARFDAALNADIGLVERLVWFWSNHFSVASDKNGFLRATCGAFEREAIRPHVFGRFSDLLVAVETHPAMLVYLDNVRSIGPNSAFGRARGKGLNENLAREILELHTLGVRTVYTQADVTNFAKVITGWSIWSPIRDAVRGGAFRFNERLHEPGPQVVLQKTYPDMGFDQGKAVLLDVARHPSTARHIATKLATHFVADMPPASLVDHLSQRFIDTDGNLKEVTKALLSSKESWDNPRSKIKPPGEWAIGALRASGARAVDVHTVMQACNMLGEPTWTPPSPKGFSDDSAAWMDGISERLDLANRFGEKFESAVEPGLLLDRILGPLATPDTRSAIARASDRSQAFALLVMAPEFLRR